MHKTLKTIWVSSGILIFLWTAFWFWKVRVLNEYEMVGSVLKLVVGEYLLILYIIVAIVYFINRKMYRKKKRKSKIKWKSKK